MAILVSFLGLGKFNKTNGKYFYDEVIYHFPDAPENGVRTCYVAEAFARLLGIDEVRLIATDKAWTHHSQALEEALSAFKLRVFRIPDGKNEQELREQFRVLREALSDNPERKPLVLDITHGFRTQPFFAASVLTVLQAAGDLPEDVRIVYGAFDAGHERDGIKHVPIWDLSTFLDQQEIAIAISVFLRTGHAERLIDVLKKERRRLAIRAQRHERDAMPGSTPLIQALEAFSEDLSTLRLPDLMRGRGKNEASAARLLAALESYRDEHCNRDHPALVPLLDDIRAMAEGLIIPSFASAERNRAMQHLMALYLRFHRYLEAAAVAREETVNALATGDAIEPATANFDNAARHRIERQATEIREIRNKWNVRNDLLHCAMRNNPLPADKVIKQVHELTDFASAMSYPRPRTLFVTRHAGAREWAERKGIVVDEILDHLEPDMVRPGDLIIGNLPIHLVAEINRRGARYKHLSIDIPPEKRGEELSADDMERYGARLEEFMVVSAKESKQKGEST